MPITPDDVTQAYVHILGRKPENQDVIKHHTSHTSTIWELIKALLQSAEFQIRSRTSANASRYQGYTPEEAQALERHHVVVPSKEGFVASFVGSYTDVTFFKHIDHLSGVVEGIPVPSNFHADAAEWIGSLKAVDSAKNSFTAAEIGAGWGPWLVDTACAARNKGIRDIHLVAVEADTGHFEYVQRHLENNGFDPRQHTLIHGIAGEKDGEAFFPVVDSQIDWGAAAIFAETNAKDLKVDYRGLQLTHQRLGCYSPGTILKKHRVFDLCHIDVQGAEYGIIAPSIKVFRNKVRYLVIGTHSRKIEGDLMELLSGDGWILENEKPCVFNLNVQGKAITTSNTLIDGVQVWRNPLL